MDLHSAKCGTQCSSSSCGSCGSGSDQHTWKQMSSSCIKIPHNAVYAGNDSNGKKIYVGRSNHNGNWCPAKVIPEANYVAIGWQGVEIKVDKFDLLCGSGYSWKSGYSVGDVPPRAVSTGTTTSGEMLYVGRGPWKNSITPGKIHPSWRCLFIPHSGIENRIDNNYEVLIYENDSSCGTAWVPSANGCVPSNAIEGGRTSNGEKLYIGRSLHCGDLIPGKIHPLHKCLYISYGGKELKFSDYEVLVKI